MRLLIVVLLISTPIFSNAQEWLWANSSNEPPGNFGEGANVAVDHSGNIYEVGVFGSTITLGTFTFTAPYPGDGMFLVKYDSMGNVVWAKSAAGANFSQIFVYGIAIDSSDNIFITGGFECDTISFDSFEFYNKNSCDVFLAKYNSAGDVLWVRVPIGQNDGDFFQNFGVSVSTDDLGNCYVAGHFSSSSISFDSYVLDNTGIVNIFISKYDAFGNVIWAKATGGDGGNYAHGVAADHFGNVYLTGEFLSSKFTLGNDTLDSENAIDIFLAKFNSLGNFLWGQKYGTDLSARPYSVAADNSGNVFLTGSYRFDTIIFDVDTLLNSGADDAFITKFDSSGKVLWAKSGNGIGEDRGFSLAVTQNGEAFISGSFQSPSITFGSTIIQEACCNPMFIVELNSEGNVVCSAGLNSGGAYQNAVATDETGNAYIGGTFIDDPFMLGAISLTLSGSQDAFIAKFICSDIENASEIDTQYIPSISPNPVQNLLTIDLENQINNPIISIYDLQGRMISLPQTFSNNKAQLNVENLSDGFYTLQIRDKNSNKTSFAKFVKE